MHKWNALLLRLVLQLLIYFIYECCWVYTDLLDRNRQLNAHSRTQDDTPGNDTGLRQQRFQRMGWMWIRTNANDDLSFPFQRWYHRLWLEQIDAMVDALQNALGPHTVYIG